MVICIDGSADEYLDTTMAFDRMPNLKKMATEGYRGMVRGALPSFTNVNNSSIVTDRHSLGIIKPACVACTQYQFSENFKNGERQDLRILGHDLSEGGDIKLRIENKQVKLFINSKEVLKTHYEKSIGKIMGVKISFSGIGYFENFHLSDISTKEKF